MERLTANIKETAQMLGVSTETFRLMRRDPNFPLKPLPYCKSRYYIKSIIQYLDKSSGFKPESANHDDIIFGRLKNGEVSREVSASA
jgi:hypothetical protein